MSGGSGQSGKLLPMKTDMTRLTGRQLLVRPAQSLAMVPLDDVLVSELKQVLPTFRALELTALNERFADTTFEKPTISLQLRNVADDDNAVKVTLKDLRRNVPQPYKQRQQMVPIKELANLLASVTDKGIVRIVDTEPRKAFLKRLLETEKLSPTGFVLWMIDERRKYLLPLMERLAYSGQIKSAAFCFGDHDADWRQLAHCLAPFTTLQRLQLCMAIAHPPPGDWLKKAILANAELKTLKLAPEIFFSSVVAGALPTIASVDHIAVDDAEFEKLSPHVDGDLRGQGPCLLTEFVLNMAQTGRLTISFYDAEDEPFAGDLLRLCHYLLSLHKTGKTVLVQTNAVDVERMAEFVADLGHYYSSLTETTAGGEGKRYRYRLRVGSVTMYFYG